MSARQMVLNLVASVLKASNDQNEFARRLVANSARSPEALESANSQLALEMRQLRIIGVRPRLHDPRPHRPCRHL
jgi:hypothetical protein